LLIGVVLVGFWSTNAGLLVTACLGCGLGALARGTAIDLRELRLPNFWTAVAFASGLAGSFVATSGADAVRGVVVATAPFLLIHLLDPKALGFGDVKYAGAAGSIVAVVWWPATILMVVVALTTSLIGRVVRPSGPRAFGPYLMAGTLVASLAATTLLGKGLVA
jgi:leader peptidase (prepilin peptidase)/N-methyltransferase